MNATLTNRLSTVTGLALAGAIAAWWLGSTLLALDHGAYGGRSASDALNALLLIRSMALAILGARLGALRGWRIGVTAGMVLIAPSWPLVALAYSASTASLTHVALAELLLLAGSAVVPMLGAGLRRLPGKPEFAVVTATGVGTALAASMWLTFSSWQVPSP